MILGQKSPPGVSLQYWNRYEDKWEMGTKQVSWLRSVTAVVCLPAHLNILCILQQAYLFVKREDKSLTVLVNDDDSHQEMAVLFHGQNITMTNMSAIFLDDMDKVSCIITTF